MRLLQTAHRVIAVPLLFFRPHVSARTLASGPRAPDRPSGERTARAARDQLAVLVENSFACRYPTSGEYPNSITAPMMWEWSVGSMLSPAIRPGTEHSREIWRTSVSSRPHWGSKSFT